MSLVIVDNDGRTTTTVTTTFVSAFVLTRIDYSKSLFFESKLDPKALDIGAKLRY